MRKNFKRRDFVKKVAFGGAGLALSTNAGSLFGRNATLSGRIGIIGLDTSHSVAFTKSINSTEPLAQFEGFRIVAAYPKGSNDIKSSVDRIPGYIEEVKKFGVEIVNSIDELIEKVDFVLLETNDGRIHLEQAIPVMKAGKRMFIDKPIAASLADTIAIFNASDYYKSPVFSSSSLRYVSGIKEIAEGAIGKVTGADSFSPCSLEKTHPDLFWYGVHGVETLFAVMGPGCKTVTRINTPDTDIVAGVWKDNRIGTFRGMRSGKSVFGGNVFGETGIMTLGNYNGYDPLLFKIIEFFKTGVVPVPREETLGIFSFMQAADVSKEEGGRSVDVEKVMADAIALSDKINIK